MSSGLPAAQYVRTSRSYEDAYIDHQKAVISKYARSHGFRVVTTYEDRGRSGLVLNRRPGLARLLDDIVNGRNAYECVLVYDISRWGRFQDADEAAHYEFICKRSGVNVCYCNEGFPNDGNALNTVLKNLKRSVAGEFSRELSERVYQAQKRQILLGFRMGGSAGYGLRRSMIAQDGRRLQTLIQGQWKCSKLNHTILIPGPKREVDLVREIFSMADSKGMKCSQIACELNLRGIPCAAGKPWGYYDIERMLQNPKYVGCNAWSRTSGKLGLPRRSVSPENWITKPDAFVPIIDQCTYDRVQAILRRRNPCKWTDEKLLRCLKRLLARKGRLSQDIIDEAPGLPSSATFYAHFGPLRRTYPLVGYKPRMGTFSKVLRRDQTEKLRLQLFKQIQVLFPDDVSVFHQTNRRRSILRLDNGLSVSVVICRSRRLPTGELAWRLYPTRSERDYITLLCRLNSKNDGFRDFHILARLDKRSCFSFTSRSSWLRKTTRLADLAAFYERAKMLGRIQD